VANKTVTVKPTGGTYTTLAGAIAGELVANANLVTMAGILHIEIDGDWSAASDTATVLIDGFTTSAAYYPHIYTTATARHAGIWNDDKYTLVTTNSRAIAIADPYVRIEGLQVKTTGAYGAPSYYGIATITGGTNALVGYCLAKVAESNTKGFGFGTDENGSITFYNCIAYDCAFAGFGNYGGTVIAYNCTAVDCRYGFETTYGVNTWTNCLSHGGTTADFANLGGGNPTVTYCASTDTTADDWGGAGNHISHTFTFVNEAADNFLLDSTDVGAIDLGTSNPGSGLYSDDIIGTARGATWDIGASEYVAAAPTGYINTVCILFES
jgi:hypothetical protein